MACCLVGNKPFSESMLAYCQLDHMKHISVKFESNHNNFYCKNVLKMSAKCDHFALASMCQIIKFSPDWYLSTHQETLAAYDFWPHISASPRTLDGRPAPLGMAICTQAQACLQVEISYCSQDNNQIQTLYYRPDIDGLYYNNSHWAILSHTLIEVGAARPYFP